MPFAAIINILKSINFCFVANMFSIVIYICRKSKQEKDFVFILNSSCIHRHVFLVCFMSNVTVFICLLETIGIDWNPF